MAQHYKQVPVAKVAMTLMIASMAWQNALQFQPWTFSLSFSFHSISYLPIGFVFSAMLLLVRVKQTLICFSSRKTMHFLGSAKFTWQYLRLQVSYFPFYNDLGSKDYSEYINATLVSSSQSNTHGRSHRLCALSQCHSTYSFQ